MAIDGGINGIYFSLEKSNLRETVWRMAAVAAVAELQSPIVPILLTAVKQSTISAALPPEKTRLEMFAAAAMADSL